MSTPTNPPAPAAGIQTPRIVLESSDDVDTRTNWSLLLQGPPGAGKTTTALQFPKPFLADLDNKSGGTIRAMRAMGMNPKFKRCVPDIMADPKHPGQTIARPIKDRYNYLADYLAVAASDDEVETYIIDGCTKLDAYIVGEIARQKPSFEGGKTRGPGEMSLPDWNTHGYLWQNFVTNLMATGKLCVFIAHEEYSDIPNLPGAVLINIRGKKIQQSLAGMFTDVWRCEVEDKPKAGGGRTYERYIRTMQTSTLQLQNTFGLPDRFVMNWETVFKALNKDASSNNNKVQA